MKSFSIMAAGLVAISSTTCEGVDDHHRREYIPPKKKSNNIFGTEQQQQNIFAKPQTHHVGQKLQVCNRKTYLKL